MGWGQVQTAVPLLMLLAAEIGARFFLRKKAALVFRNAGTVRKTASQFSSPTA